MIFKPSILAILAAAALAQSNEPERSSPDDKPTPPAKEQQPLPGLDELLGLPPKPAPTPQQPADKPEPATPPPADKELDRKLTGREMNETFAQAVTLMGDTADRLARHGDTGIDTQRIQEEIIKRLDTLIETAREQQQQQSSSSSSSSSSAQQPQPQQEQQRGRQPSGENTTAATPPGMQTGPLRESLDAARASWGALPARVRDALLQGSGEKYSSLYEALTEEYYRRLAEESPKP